MSEEKKIVEAATVEVVAEKEAPLEHGAVKKYRAPAAKAGKVIVRNLIFDLREKHLTAVFKKYGLIKDVSVPLNPSTNTNRGFGFVEFETREEATNAIAEMNGSKFKGRNLTVEFSVPKESYEKRIDNILGATNMERKDVIKPVSVKNEIRTEKDAKAKAEEEQKVIEANKTVT